MKIEVNNIGQSCVMHLVALLINVFNQKDTNVIRYNKENKIVC